MYVKANGYKELNPAPAFHAETYSRQNVLFNTQGYPVPPPEPKPKIPKYTWAQKCSCVLYAKALTGYSKPVGSARNWPVNHTSPEPGAVAVFYGGRYGHVVVILDVDYGARTFTVTESNSPRCTIRSGKVISFDHPLLKGYYKQ